MAKPRDIRRLALQLLFQLDAREDMTEQDLQQAVDNALSETKLSLSTGECERAIATANAAYEARRAADRAIKEFAPTWPAHRQPAVDRALLRLAHYEMTQTDINPKIPVNEAIELSKEFSTERSPAFVNALLDKILKQILAENAAAPAPEDQP
jgi:N utilization substance protein B